MAFSGWLIKVNGTAIPMKYIKHDTYKITSNQRIELEAERDMSGVLHRTTTANMPVKIEFQTTAITNTDVATLNALIGINNTSNVQRSCTVNYYDPETDSYKTQTCYVPDLDYQMYSVDTSLNKIVYETIRYAFIGY